MVQWLDFGFKRLNQNAPRDFVVAVGGGELGHWRAKRLRVHHPASETRQSMLDRVVLGERSNLRGDGSRLLPVARTPKRKYMTAAARCALRPDVPCARSTLILYPTASSRAREHVKHPLSRVSERDTLQEQREHKATKNHRE